MMYTKEMQTRKKKKRMKHPKSLLHEKNGTCYLCMHQIGQRAFEETHSRQQFIDIFGKSYL